MANQANGGGNATTDQFYPGAEGATQNFSNFIADAKYEDIPPQAITKLLDLIIDHIGVGDGGGAQSDILKAVEAFSEGCAGESTVYGKTKTYPKHIAALLNGAFAHSFDFDDTLAIGIIHPGASVIPAALAQAEASNASGRQLLTGLSVGYEIKGLTGEQVYNAFGLAGSKAAGSMQFLDNGSWNKRLHPGFAAHDAFLCVALAEAGVTGASHAIEGKWGFLQAYSTKSKAAGLTEDLGSEWLFAATAMKPFPACRFTHTAIEITARVAAEAKSGELPQKITVWVNPSGYDIIGRPSPNKLHPETIVDAQFSMYYQVAVAWLFGSEAGWSVYDSEKMKDKKVAELCDRVEVVTDDSFKEEFEVRMSFQGVDGGAAREEALVYPLGEVEHPFSRENVSDKFWGLVQPVYDQQRAENILKAVDNLSKSSAAELLKFL
uniref:MmgE/PrpD family protein n=1 Tax=Colletotrichum fructicola (strain Nara gc5) TaxID=1213859 RepID=L2FV62_COLFN